MTTSAVPQYRLALARANAVRLESAAMRRRVRELPRREALLRVADWFDDPPEPIQRTRADLVLCAVPRLGQIIAWRMLAAVNAYGVRYVGPTVGGSGRRALSERQRRVIAAELRRMAGVGTEGAGELREAA